MFTKTLGVLFLRCHGNGWIEVNKHLKCKHWRLFRSNWKQQNHWESKQIECMRIIKLKTDREEKKAKFKEVTHNIYSWVTGAQIKKECQRKWAIGRLFRSPSNHGNHGNHRILSRREWEARRRKASSWIIKPRARSKKETRWNPAKKWQ